MIAVLQRALVWLPVALVTAMAMDRWAALLHRRMWHGPLWSVHRSHHAPRDGRFERNDALSVLHAPIAVAFILYGCLASPAATREGLFGVGIGMTAFGVAYVVVHDGLVHERLPVRFLLRLRYLRAVVAAHRRHHAAASAGPPYGLFFGPSELRRAARLRRRGVTPAPGRQESASGSTTPRRAPSGPRPEGRGPA